MLSGSGYSTSPFPTPTPQPRLLSNPVGPFFFPLCDCLSIHSLFIPGPRLVPGQGDYGRTFLLRNNTTFRDHSRCRTFPYFGFLRPRDSFSRVRTVFARARQKCCVFTDENHRWVRKIDSMSRSKIFDLCQVRKMLLDFSLFGAIFLESD